MFVELVEGRAVDPAALHQAWDGALAAIAGEATGWLGATSGVSADGRFVAILGFESEEAARITMDRVAGRATWDGLAALVDDLRFRECPNVRAFGLSDPRGADLVELTQGAANDVGRVAEAFDRSSRAAVADESVVGGLLCWDDAGFTSSALYRRSPAAGTASTADLVREEASVLIDRPAHLELARPWSILTFAPPPPPRDPAAPA